MTTTTMRNLLAALVAVLALVAPAAGDETQSCSAGARFDDGAGATAVRAELDAMDHALAQAKSSLRALETLVETQGARLETMRALVATPGVTCDGSVAAAERLADAMLETRCETRCAERHDRSSAFGRPRDERGGEKTYRDVDESSNTIVARATHSSHSSIQRGSYATDRPAVARRLDAWADHLSLTGAVRLERGAEATAMATLPQRDPERGDVPRYFAVGDSRGKTRVLRADGDVAATLPDDSDDDATEASSPDASFAASLDAASPNARETRDERRGRAVSALAASYQRKNETVVVAGDASGRVVFYQVFESADSGEDTERTLAGTVFASYPSLRAISPKHARGLAVPAKTANWEKERDRLVKAARRETLNRAASGHLATETFDRLETSAVIEATVGVKHPQGARYAERDEPTNSDSEPIDSEPIDSEAARAIVAVAAYRLNDGKRYFAVADASGALVVFTDRGATVHSVYRLPSSDDDRFTKKTDQTDHVVAFKPSRRAISWVTRSGVGSLDPATFAARRAPCAAADGARLDVAFASVAFDAAHAARFYAVTEAGETVAGVVGGVDVGTGAGVRATCALRHRNLGSTPAAAVERWNGASLASVKGYAFVALGARVSVLNATDAKRSGARVSRAPREVIVADVEHLAGAFGGAVGDATDCDAGGGEDAADAADAAAGATECSYDFAKSSRGARSALVATDARGAFVAVGLPGGFIAMYESALYVWKPEPVNTKLWSQPLFVAAMGAVATFQFYRSKNGSGRRFATGADGGSGGFGADADALRRFDRMTRASRGPDASFDPAAFRKQMERDGRWKRATRE